VKIGISGHQVISDPSRWIWVHEQFEAILRERCTSGEWVIGALAVGADQLFVRTALQLGLLVETVIPCTKYETTFVSPEELLEYKSLLKRSSKVCTLSFETPSEDAFLAAGLHVVDHCDLLVALWNGKPAAGKGGTGDIVAYAREMRKPLIHVHSDLAQVHMVTY